MSKPN